MPSRFPWSKSSSTQPYNADPALDIPRSSSRQELAYTPRPSPLEGSYNPYVQQAHQSTSSFDSSSPPPTADPQPSAHQVGQEQPIITQPYEQHAPYPVQISVQKGHTSKKSLRSKLLGSSSLSKDDPEANKDIFGRKKSIRRKEAPVVNDSTTTQQEDPAGPWPLNTQVGQQSNRSGTFEPYSPDFSSAHVESRDYQNLPPPPPPHGEQQYTNYSAAQTTQTRYTSQQLHRSQWAEGSVGTSTPPPRPSFESLPQPPSRPDSRPISRQSYDRQSAGVSQAQVTQQEQFQVQSSQDPYQQQIQQGSPGGLTTQPSQRQQRQTQPADTTKLNIPSRENAFASNPSALAASDSNLQSTQGLVAGMPRGQQVAQEGDMRARTPPPPRSANEMTETEVNQLIRDHREMKQKYNNVKRQYFDKRDQVDTLQNTLAHQRLAQSRTHWDDGEYITRLTRLDGLISQLSFGMRKDWKTIPDWLQPQCNKDALQLGKAEMIAVGRAFVSCWLADELFDKYFHPGLPLDISAHLKMIQRNIRDFAPASHSTEEVEALTSKIINWRLATVDGLQSILATAEAGTNRQSLTRTLNEKLVQDLKRHMQQDPPPAGLEGGVDMIIDLSVGILGNLPLESRDIHITYFDPGHPIVQDMMKIETGIPPLVDSMHPSENAEGEQASLKSAGTGAEGSGHDFETESGNNNDEQGKRGFPGGLVGAGKRPVSPQRSYSAKQGSLGVPNQISPPQQTSASREDRVRMCLFLGAQNRGKMVLFKAPVFRM